MKISLYEMQWVCFLILKYIFTASGKNGTIYNGVTNNLIKRVAQHKRKEVKGFTEKYEVNKLVWYEQTNDIRIAIKREKTNQKMEQEMEDQID